MKLGVTMINTYKKILQLLNSYEKKRALLLLILMVIVSIVEVISIASIMPFLAVLSNPSIVETNEYLTFIYDFFKFNNLNSFLIFLGFVTLGILITSTFIRALSQYGLLKFSNMRRHSLSIRLLNKYLHQPYSYFLSRNTSEMSKTILSETDQVVSQVIQPAFNILVYSFLSLSIVLFLIVVNTTLALVLTLVFGIIYTLIFSTIKGHLSKIGEERKFSNAKRFKIASEALSGIKDIKVLGREKVYLDSFKEPSLTFSLHQATAKTLSILPQYFIEVIAFGAIMIILLFNLSANDGKLEEFLPLLGLYTFAIMKLKPAMNAIYSNLATLRFGESALNGLLHDLDEENITKIENDNKRLMFKDNLILEHVNFSYDSTDKLALKEINIILPVNKTLGIIGTTGAGKSTLVDIMLGLLIPSSGLIRIDNTVLNQNNCRQWQNCIGYVPQSIFLADDTISSNIAFGIEKEKIDIKQVENVAKMAQVDEFINNLENGYDTVIGERGVRLSGGQRQRLGIARALYSNPELLVLDEATSALDNQTEIEVMKAITNMSGSKTIVIIAHRLNTIEKCDVIIKLENGKIIYD